MRCVGTHVGSALLLRHRHAHSCTRLPEERHIISTVSASDQLVQQIFEVLTLLLLMLLTQRRNSSEGHSYRAADSGIKLVHEVHQCPTNDMSSLMPLVLRLPCEGGSARLQSQLHELVVRWVIFSSITSTPKTVMALQAWRVAVCVSSASLPLSATHLSAQALQMRGSPSATVCSDSFHKSGITGVGIVIRERRCLVKDLMGCLPKKVL
mmetsp:Transcript_90777/g.160065  ORF Transcript_90777/g.160065 Transcript_90777/m.160065 type:complete len:209 (+) Transcript_90777:223-849(+)